MIGRGIIANPALLDIIIRERETVDKLLLREFHDRIYSDYAEMMSGEVPLLYKMCIRDRYDGHEDFEYPGIDGG